MGFVVIGAVLFLQGFVLWSIFGSKWPVVIIALFAAFGFLYGLYWLALGVFATLTRWIDKFVGPTGLLRGFLWAITIMGIWTSFLWVLSNLENITLDH